MIHTAIVEDDVQDAALLKQMLDQFAQESGQEFSIQHYPTAESFLQTVHSYDLVFMDIEMPGLNGMQAAYKLREFDSQTTLIFVTNMAQYALHGYDVGALDFILKPLQYGSFCMKMKKAVRNIAKNRDTVITLALPNGLVRVAASQIYYVEVQKHYLTYHTETGDYTVRESMRAAEEMLQPMHFMRCNNCYLVNLRRVVSVSDNTVQVGPHTLQISRPRHAAFLKGLTDYLGGNPQ